MNPCTVCAMYDLNMLEYNAIICVIPKEWKFKLSKRLDAANMKESMYEQILKQKKPTAFFLKQLWSNKNNLETYFAKWDNDPNINFDFDQYAQAFKYLYVVMNNSKLRSFQYRMLHRAVVLNDKLFKWKVKQNNLCSNCGKNAENMYHFFWECHAAKNGIKWFKKLLSEYGIVTENGITYSQWILNKLEVKKVIANFFVLLLKHYMYVCRCLKETPTENGYRKKIDQILRFEKYQAEKIICYENTKTSGQSKIFIFPPKKTVYVDKSNTPVSNPKARKERRRSI